MKRFFPFKWFFLFASVVSRLFCSLLSPPFSCRCPLSVPRDISQLSSVFPPFVQCRSSKGRCAKAALPTRCQCSFAYSSVQHSQTSSSPSFPLLPRSSRETAEAARRSRGLSRLPDALLHRVSGSAKRLRMKGSTVEGERQEKEEALRKKKDGRGALSSSFPLIPHA